LKLPSGSLGSRA